MRSKFLGEAWAGFTLTEVLVNLTIIGIIASLTIPSLIQLANENEYNVGVKKVFSELSKAIMMIQNNNETVRVGTDNTDVGAAALRSDFCSVMSCVKIDTTTNIFGPKKYKGYKGNELTNLSVIPAAILNDGSYLRFRSYSNCSAANTPNPAGDVNACGLIGVDINGTKLPNIVGLDYYTFWIVLKNGAYYIIPQGTPGDGKSCVAGSITFNTSDGCTYERLLNSDHMP